MICPGVYPVLAYAGNPKLVDIYIYRIKSLAMDIVMNCYMSGTAPSKLVRPDS